MNQGTCQCGECVCKEGFEGKYCQKFTNDDNYCKPLLPCVIYKAYSVMGQTQGLQKYKDQCRKNSHEYTIFGNELNIACDRTKLLDGNGKLYP